MRKGLSVLLTGAASLLLMPLTVKAVFSRKKMLDNYRKNEARYLSIFSSETIGIMVSSLAGPVLEVNDTFLRLIGYSRERFERDGLRWDDITPPEYHKLDRQKAEEIRQVGFATEYEKQYFHRDGRRVDVLLSGITRIRDTSNLVIAYVLDITERKRIEKSLQESEARFRQLSDSNLLGIAFWNIYGKVYEANDTFLRTLGYQRDELESGVLNWQSLTLPEEQWAHAERVQKAIRGEKILPYETVFIHKAGHKIDALVAYAMLEGSRDQGFVFVLDISETKRAECALKDSEKRFRMMAAAMPQKVWTALPNGQMNYMNEKWFEYSGLSWEALQGFQWLDVIHPEERAETLTVWEEALNTMRASQIAHRMRRHDGEYRWHLSRGVPSLDEEGRLMLWVGTSTDIDDLQRIQASLRESEERFRSLADSVPVLIWLSDAHGKNTYTNKTCASYTGKQFDALQDLDWLAFIHPEDREPTVSAMMASIEKKESYQYQYRAKRHDGVYRWMQVIGLPRFTPEGELLGYVGSAVDITEQKEMNQLLETAIEERTRQLQKSNALLSSIVDNVPAMIFLKEANELRFELFNKTGRELVGFTDAQLLGKNDYDFFPREQADFFVAKDRETLRGKSLVDISEEPIQTVKGELKYLHTKKVPILDEQGEPVYLLGISEDITELKKNQQHIRDLNVRLEDQVRDLNALNQELESFSYSVSHDLRAPLRTIDGFSQMILEDYGDRLDEEGNRYLRRIREGSRQMAQLIDDMLNLSRLTRGELRKETVNLSDLARSIELDLRMHEPERQVEFVVQDNLFVEVDRRLIQAVLENLIGNAWKFTSQRLAARIEFGMVEQEGKPVYYVKDNGAGFDMAYADKLFGTFQRLHNVTEFTGTGVGLASAQRVIHRHGGKIWAYGEVEKGATFYFTLE